MRVLHGTALLGLALLAGCVAETPRPPQPAPVRPAPPPRAPPPAPRPEWEDLPATPGTWSYFDEPYATEARFAAGGEPSFIVRCDPRSRQVSLLRPGVAGAGSMTIRTSSGARSFPLSAAGAAAATVSQSDPFLDGIAFSRGHFSVEIPGSAMLVLPAWPEPARVVEDCRG